MLLDSRDLLSSNSRNVVVLNLLALFLVSTAEVHYLQFFLVNIVEESRLRGREEEDVVSRHLLPPVERLCALLSLFCVIVVLVMLVVNNCNSSLERGKILL